ncbi:MAG: hypothetical protein K6E33_09725, partial [Lachnospiraceae bacterium]|nr:hypothetical protein [Lachnospiraceae bacterium]
TSFIPARRKPGVTEKMFNIKDLGPDGLNYWMPTPWDRMIRVDLLREHNIRFQNLPDLDDLYFGHTTSICAKNIVYSKNEKPLVIYRVNNPKQMTYHVDSRSMIKAIRKLLELDVVNNDREFKEMVINMMNSNLDGMMSRCPNEEYNKECLEEAREIRNSFNS